MQQRQQHPPHDATVDYWPRGASADLFRHHESEVVIAGPAGTGKTYGALWRLHLAALKYPGMRGIMLRKVQEDLTASALVTYQERVLGAGSFGVRPFGGSKIKPAGFQYPNGAELLIGGLDKAERVMSREYDLIYVNETTELDLEDWELLSTRARWGVMPYQQLYGDCNPQGPTHWLYQRSIAGTLALLTSIHEDNPMLFDRGEWTAQGQSYLATLDKLSGHTRQRLRHGLWVAAEGAVYPAFNRQTHVKQVETSGWAAVLGLDLGATHPNALLTVRFAGERVHIERELYRTEMTATEIIDATSEEYQDARAEFVVVDPSAKDIRLDLQRRGLHVRLGQNAITVGIKRVSALLPNLTIDPSCVNTIAEFESYRYPDRSHRDVPEDKHNHCLIAGTVVETAHGPKPIERIVAGEFVWTRQGLRPVVAAGMTNPSVQVYTLLADDGTRLTGSSLHPVWTENRGWVMLDSLRYGDTLYGWNQRSSSSTASSFGATPTQRIGRIGRTSRQALPSGSGALAACMKRFGRNITALFQPVITSITSMMTRSITTQKILPVGLLLSTCAITGPNRRVHARSPILNEFGRSLRRGIGRTKGEPGTVNTGSRHGRTVKALSERVISAGSRSPALRSAKMTASAATTASRHGVEHLASTMNHVSAPPVAIPSPSTATALPAAAHVSVRGLSVEPKRQAVYNLTVAHTPEFFANGILVHNSMDVVRYVAMELGTPKRKVRVW